MMMLRDAFIINRYSVMWKFSDAFHEDFLLCLMCGRLRRLFRSPFLWRYTEGNFFAAFCYRGSRKTRKDFLSWNLMVKCSFCWRDFHFIFCCLIFDDFLKCFLEFFLSRFKENILVENKKVLQKISKFSISHRHKNIFSIFYMRTQAAISFIKSSNTLRS